MRVPACLPIHCTAMCWTGTVCNGCKTSRNKDLYINMNYSFTGFQISILRSRRSLYWQKPCDFYLVLVDDSLTLIGGKCLNDFHVSGGWTVAKTKQKDVLSASFSNKWSIIFDANAAFLTIMLVDQSSQYWARPIYLFWPTHLMQALYARCMMEIWR